VDLRTGEFGVRKALGAQTRDLLLLVAWQGGVPVVAGLVAGICALLAFSRVLSGFLYGVQPMDARVLAMVSLMLLLVAAFAIAWPARRAARVDPMTALRDTI